MPWNCCGMTGLWPCHMTVSTQVVVRLIPSRLQCIGTSHFSGVQFFHCLASKLSQSNLIQPYRHVYCSQSPFTALNRCTSPLHRSAPVTSVGTPSWLHTPTSYKASSTLLVNHCPLTRFTCANHFKTSQFTPSLLFSLSPTLHLTSWFLHLPRKHVFPIIPSPWLSLIIPPNDSTPYVHVGATSLHTTPSLHPTIPLHSYRWYYQSSYNSLFTPKLTLLTLRILFNAPKVCSPSPALIFTLSSGPPCLLEHLRKQLIELKSSTFSSFISTSTWGVIPILHTAVFCTFHLIFIPFSHFS